MLLLLLLLVVVVLAAVLLLLLESTDAARSLPTVCPNPSVVAGALLKQVIATRGAASLAGKAYSAIGRSIPYIGNFH